MLPRAKAVSDAVTQALRHHVQSPFTLTARSTERVAFGIPALDAVCHGGAPAGAITEMVGGQCSGRTTAAIRLIGGLTAAGSTCAWVDASDALDPESAAANGVVLPRLLWVRCGSADMETRRVRPEQVPERRASTTSGSGSTGGGSPHPRSEGRGMPSAIQDMFAMRGSPAGFKDCARQKIGTPGAANRKLGASAVDREEQVATDRLPPRRFAEGGAPTQKVEVWQQKGIRAEEKVPGSAGADLQPRMHRSTLWRATDQALRATDLLLTNGGFRVIVLDFASLPAEYVWRIPLATWFRYRAACERSQTSLLLLTRQACARSSAGLVLRFGEPQMQTQGPVMTGMQFQAAPERSRLRHQPECAVISRKPPQSVRSGVWQSQAAWV